MAVLGWVLVLLALATAAVHADGLDDVRGRGTLTVAVTADSPPWGSIPAGAAGAPVGFEPDLARDLAQRLGMPPTLLPARTKLRAGLLDSGRADVLIATLSDTPERRAALGLIEPGYYAAGRNVLVARFHKLRAWEDLGGKRVCASQGSYYAETVRARYGADLVYFVERSGAVGALRAAVCWAWLADDAAILDVMRQSAAWSASYEMPLPTEDVRPWLVAVAKPMAQDRLAREIAQVVGEWHRSGWLVERHAFWVKRGSPFLDAMHAVWLRRADTGEWICDATRPLAEPCRTGRMP